MLNKTQAQLRTKKSRSFFREEDGSVAAIFGLMAIALFLMIGGAVDFGRWLHARQQTLAAMDAAVLAAGRSMQVHANPTMAVAAAEAFYAQNTQTRLPLKTDTISFSVSDDGLSVTASGNASIETPFLSLAQINELSILAKNGVDYSKAELAVGNNAGINLEISMMLDVTGSMGGSRIEDLKTAAKDLIDIVVWDDQSEYSSRVALVPFSEGVRLPNNAAIKQARGKNKDLPVSKDWYGNTVYRSHCVAERQGANAYTDAAPGPGNYATPVYVFDQNGECKPSANNKLVPLTNQKQKLKNKINNLETTGGTAGHLGTAWAWYTLSPNWNSLWNSADNDAVDYNTPETRKIAILMTDGTYNRQYDSNGVSVWSSSATNGSSTTQARAMCTAMKAAGITVYTVGFGLSSGSSAATTMAQCATDSNKAFTAADGEQLKQSFRAIALEISQLYLSS